MEKFTNVNWKIDARPFHQYGVYHISNGDYVIATAMGQTSSCETEAREVANAITAAPSLYRSLAAMIERFDTQTAEMLGDASPDTSVGALIIAAAERREEWVSPHRAALAKARGEAT